MNATEGSVLGGLIASAGAWLIARLKQSGRVGTTEATRLWDASERIRADQTAQNATLLARLDRIEERHTTEIGKLQAEHMSCQVELAKLHGLLTAAGIGERHLYHPNEGDPS